MTKTTRNPKPLPCPFCGSPPEVQDERPSSLSADAWVVTCSHPTCRVAAFTVSPGTRADVIAAWNTRAPAEDATDE